MKRVQFEKALAQQHVLPGFNLALVAARKQA